MRPMPCNCPDDKIAPPLPQSGCAYLVHSGGPVSNLYRLVEHAIPDVEMAHGRPTVHADGSLEFPGPPARHPWLPAGRLSPLPRLAALSTANVASPSRGRSALHRGHLRQSGSGAIQP